jgi:hypothetical protein
MSNRQVNPPVLDELIAAGRDTDDLTRSPPSIDVIHSRIHRAHCFSFSPIVDIAGVNEIRYLGICGEFPIHVNGYNFTASGDRWLVELYEEPTVSANGTPATYLNRNRARDTIVPTFQLFQSPTISDLGLRLETLAVFPSGNGSTPAFQWPHEWVLRPFTAYALRIAKLQSSSQTLYGTVLWYEQRFG